MSELSQRIATGLPGIAFLIFSVYYSEYSFFALFLLITIMALWEYYGLVESEEIKPHKYLGTIMGAFIFSANFVLSKQMAQGAKVPENLLLVVIPLVFLFFLVELFKKNKNPLTNISFSLSAIIYIAFPFVLLINLIVFSMNESHYHPNILIAYFFILWANDTGAYFTGRFLGKTKLFERISPNKTWEGAIGGFITALIIGYIASRLVTELTLIDWLIISTIIVVFGTLGDLVESLFKRGLGVKDSGNILPGHGGVLDRFDSLLLSVPFVYLYMKLFVN